MTAVTPDSKALRVSRSGKVRRYGYPSPGKARTSEASRRHRVAEVQIDVRASAAPGVFMKIAGVRPLP